MSQSRRRKKNSQPRQAPSSSQEGEARFLPRFAILVAFLTAVILVAVNIPTDINQEFVDQPAAESDVSTEQGSAELPDTDAGEAYETE